MFNWVIFLGVIIFKRARSLLPRLSKDVSHACVALFSSVFSCLGTWYATIHTAATNCSLVLTTSNILLFLSQHGFYFGRNIVWIWRWFKLWNINCFKWIIQGNLSSFIQTMFLQIGSCIPVCSFTWFLIILYVFLFHTLVIRHDLAIINTSVL